MSFQSEGTRRSELEKTLEETKKCQAEVDGFSAGGARHLRDNLNFTQNSQEESDNTENAILTYCRAYEPGTPEFSLASQVMGDFKKQHESCFVTQTWPAGLEELRALKKDAVKREVLGHLAAAGVYDLAEGAVSLLVDEEMEKQTKPPTFEGSLPGMKSRPYGAFAHEIDWK